MKYDELKILVTESTGIPMDSYICEKVNLSGQDIAETAIILSPVILSIGVIISAIKKDKLDKFISKDERLAPIQDKLKKYEIELKSNMKELQKLLSKYDKKEKEYKEFAEEFKSTKIKLDSNSSLNLNDEASINSSRTKDAINPNFDPEKYEKYKKLETEMRLIWNDIMDLMTKTNLCFKDCQRCISDLRKIGKNLKKHKEIESDIDKLLKKVDQVETHFDSVKDEFNGAIKAYKESTETDLAEIKLSVYEACYDGEITSEERDLLLKSISE